MANQVTPLPIALNTGTFLFAIVVYIVIAVVLEQYDKEHGTKTVAAYTGLILLTYLTAHNTDFASGLESLKKEIGVT